MIDKVFDIVKNPKFDRYKRGLASIVYKFLDKKTSGSSIATLQNQQLDEELHRPIIKKVYRRVYSSFKGNIWGADLADMQLIRNFNKETRFLL